ncbi:hypothetical protein F5146DRAFT_1141875 [Armillaria mellea]|nr:hypothetical protein F5146DRAFT_1141875 [Armillaria mellea]
MQKMNKDRASGDCVKLKDVKAMIVNDHDYQDLSEEYQKELLDQLIALRMKKKFSIHVNNKAAAMDAHGSIGRIQQEMLACMYYMGMVGFAMFTKGCLDNPSIPECIEVDGSLDFFSESLNINVKNIICLFDKFMTT